jgi:heme exporter protein D
VNLGPHASFIVAAYGIAVLVIAALIVWVVYENHALRQRLARLHGQGLTRHSDRAAGKPT